MIQRIIQRTQILQIKFHNHYNQTMKIPSQEWFIEDQLALKKIKEKNVETSLAFFVAIYIILGNPFYPII